MASSFVLSYWNLNDAASGGARRIHALLDALGSSAVLIQPREHHPAVATVPFPTDFGRTKIGINWGMFNLMWPGNRRVACGAISTHCPALLVMTSMWAAPVAMRCPSIPAVLDAHDVNALAIAERFGDTHPFARLVRRREAAAVRVVQHLFCCSEGDRQAFMDLYGVDAERITVVPNGVDVEAFARQRTDGPPDAFWREHCAGSTVLFFMGKLDYQPNVAALNFLSETVLPELERRAPGRFRLLVTGGPVPPGPPPAGVHFAGQLSTERLREYLLRADLCLAPVFTGGGTRLKVLEYMAAGKAIVSTPKGAEGISCTADDHLAIAGPEVFSDRVLTLCNDPDRARVMGESAREFVRSHYDWAGTIRPRWQQVFDRYLRPPVVAPGTARRG